MFLKLTTVILISAGCMLLASCAGLRDSAVDQAAGFPASVVISDVTSTSKEYAEEKHQERAEELSNEYEEFLRSQEDSDVREEEQQRSVVMKRKDDEYN